MFRKLLPAAVLAGSYAGFVAALMLTYDKLPPRVASHFNASGIPDGWMPRNAYVWSMVGIGVYLPAFMIGSFYVVRFCSPSVINLPNRDYWLAPERSAESNDILFRFGLWLASLVVLLVLGLHLLTVAANTARPVVLSSYVWAILAGFLAGVGALVFFLCRRFQRLPE